MNRIRKYNNSYQVLLTPYMIGSQVPSLMLGDWYSVNMTNYCVKEFGTLKEAYCESLK